MEKELDKKVELTELFYDLVFVFAVSRSTELIHDLQGGTFEPFVFFTFVITFIILINTWMYQTVFTNRYGTNGILDHVMLFVQMGLMLILANSMGTDWESSFVPFTVSAGLLSVVLALQYVIVYFRASSGNDRRVSRVFMMILALRSTIILASLFFPHNVGIVVSLAGILLGLFAPMLFSKKMEQRPVNFPHLTERLSLLVIITFGEMIVGIATYFEWAWLSVTSIFVLLTVVMMFLIYIAQFDHDVERHKENTTGVAMIYLHYPIFFGIIMTNVAFSYLLNPEIANLFAVCFLYVGILLFMIGVLLGDLYRKKATSVWKKAAVWFGLILAGLTVSLLISRQYGMVIMITSVVMAANYAYMQIGETSFNRKKSVSNHETDSK